MDVHEIAEKLIGPIEPVGESHTDSVRFENLVETIDLVERLLMDIRYVSLNKDRQEYSMKKAGEHAEKFFRQTLEEYALPPKETP